MSHEISYEIRTEQFETRGWLHSGACRDEMQSLVLPQCRPVLLGDLPKISHGEKDQHARKRPRR
jgi:hypothetical protein